MPVEPTKNKLKRRTSRCEDHRFDPSHGRELELKRNRGLSPEFSFFFFLFSFLISFLRIALYFYRRGTHHYRFVSFIYWELFRLVAPSAEGTREYSRSVSKVHWLVLKRLKIKCDKQIPCQSCQVCPGRINYIEGQPISCAIAKGLFSSVSKWYVNFPMRIWSYWFCSLNR